MSPRPPDTPDDSLAERLVPVPLRPWSRLSRWDRPIGFWLLLLPCWWGLTLGAHIDRLATGTAPDPGRYPLLFLLFALGALAMRGAGCTLNDYIDRDLDARVARTRDRPLPSGQISPRHALVWFALQSLAGLVVLLQLNAPAIALGVASLALVAFYPWAKRLTSWPQLVLGFTFNWGVPVGVAAATGWLHPATWLLYAGGIFWTLAYDTIYALPDSQDDARSGIRSTALLFGSHVRLAIGIFALAAMACLSALVTLAGFSLLAWPFLALAAGHLAWQVLTLDIARPGNCLERFRANRITGLLILLALVAGSLPPAVS